MLGRVMFNHRSPELESWLHEELLTEGQGQSWAKEKKKSSGAGDAARSPSPAVPRLTPSSRTKSQALPVCPVCIICQGKVLCAPWLIAVSLFNHSVQKQNNNRDLNVVSCSSRLFLCVFIVLLCPNFYLSDLIQNPDNGPTCQLHW